MEPTSRTIFEAASEMHVTRKLSLLVLLVALAGYSLQTLAKTENPLLGSTRKAGEVKWRWALHPVTGRYRRAGKAAFGAALRGRS